MRLYRVVVLVALAACRGHFDDRVDTSGIDATSRTAITLSVQGHGVVLVDGHAPCADTCTYDDGVLNLSTWSGDGWQLSGFSNTCATATSCAAQPGESVTVSFARSPITANLAFVTTQLSPRTGLAGLDMTCATAASAAGLSGTFLAFASTSTVNARDRFASSRGWVRTDGLALYDTISDITLNTRPRSVSLDEIGMLIPDGTVAVTGTNENGNVNTQTCNDWTSASAALQVTVIYPAWVGIYSVSNVNTSCNSPTRVFCMQNDRNVPLPPVAPAPMGRYVFVSSQTWVPGGGIASADAECATEAAAANLSGTYAALLATTTMTAAEHVGGVRGLFRRTDGVVVSFEGLDAPELDAAITMTAGGTFASAGTLDSILGASSLNVVGDGTCSDWTDSTAVGRKGFFAVSTTPFARIFAPQCNFANRLVCVQLP
ncbi:MAG TPA: hypothetical protein VMZ53_30050 [Kofleriaceae bacterium]|nr:hypothetical protein [Kofleriaceae bacterium]